MKKNKNILLKTRTDFVSLMRHGVIILGIFFFIFCLYIVIYVKIDPFSSKQKIWGITFGGGAQKYIDTAYRLNNELLQTKVFNEIIIYTDTNLKQDIDFWKIHGSFIDNNIRGYGYWLWKPYLIMKTMEQMNDNDILIYLDAGSEIVNNEKTHEQIMSFVNKCNENDILYTLTGHDEKTYTKMDLIEYMKMNNDQIKNSIENQAGLIIIKKNTKMTDFIKEWYSTCIHNNYHLLDDSVSIIPNDSSFIDHRHDQSIFSLLTKTNKHNVNNDKNKIDPYPFLFSRKING
jgi:hypothetical protein